MNLLISTSKSKISTDEISVLDGKICIPKQYLIECTFLDDTSVLVISGSLIEGIGTPHSDIDCIVICDKRPTARDIEPHEHAFITDGNYKHIRDNESVYNTTNFLNDSSIHIDADYITFSELNKIILKIEEAHTHVTSDQRYLYEPVLSNTENNIIHRLLTGHALKNELTFSHLKSLIPIEKHIYIAHREKLPVFYAFQDIQGCWQSGNLWMGCDIARDMMLKTTMSFTYLAGTTNKHYKWVYSNIFRINGFDEIKNTFFTLSRQGAITEDECRLYILRTLDYIDMVFLAIEKLLNKSPAHPSTQKSLRALDKEFDARKHTHHKTSKCEYFFRKKYFSAEGTPSLKSLLTEWD